MKSRKSVSAVFALSLVMANDAFAGCEEFGYFPLTLFNLDAMVLSGKNIFAQDAPPGGVVTEDWKEDHCATTSGASGNLYKSGDGSAVDPRALRGTWTPNPGGVVGAVEYDYAGDPPGNPYTFTLFLGKSGLCWQGADGNVAATGTVQGDAGLPCP